MPKQEITKSEGKKHQFLSEGQRVFLSYGRTQRLSPYTLAVPFSMMLQHGNEWSLNAEEGHGHGDPIAKSLHVGWT